MGSWFSNEVDKNDYADPESPTETAAKFVVQIENIQALHATIASNREEERKMATRLALAGRTYLAKLLLQYALLQLNVLGTIEAQLHDTHVLLDEYRNFPRDTQKLLIQTNLTAMANSCREVTVDNIETILADGDEAREKEVEVFIAVTQRLSPEELTQVETELESLLPKKSGGNMGPSPTVSELDVHSELSDLTISEMEEGPETEQGLQMGS